LFPVARLDDASLLLFGTRGIVKVVHSYMKSDVSHRFQDSNDGSMRRKKPGERTHRSAYRYLMSLVLTATTHTHTSQHHNTQLNPPLEWLWRS
jgi:hypothetical protein